jgi:hypothetical protein
LRFSVFKKELIERQQQLYALLLQNNERKRRRSVHRAAAADVGCTTRVQQEEEEDDDDDDEDEEMEDDDDEYNGNERKILDDDDDEDEKDDESEPSLANSFVDDSANESEEVKPEINTKIPKRVYTCDLCSLKFHGKQGLASHMTIHLHKEKQGLFKCSIEKCDFRTNTNNKLRIHKTRYHNKDRSMPIKRPEKPNKSMSSVRYPCHCGCRCFHPRSLHYHMIRYHGGINRCTFGCETQFKTTGLWMRHVREVHPEHEKMCMDIANALKIVDMEDKAKECSVEEEPEEDEEEKEKEQKKFECPECYKNFNHSSSLRMHINTIHNDNRRFTCSECGKKLKQLSHLREHLRKVHKKDNRVRVMINVCSYLTLISNAFSLTRAGATRASTPKAT